VSFAEKHVFPSQPLSTGSCAFVKRLAKDWKLFVQGSSFAVFLQHSQHAGDMASWVVTGHSWCKTRNIWKIKPGWEQGKATTESNSPAILLHTRCTHKHTDYTNKS